MAVAFDAVGPSASGTTSATSPLTWTHVCGASATHLLVGATWDGNPDGGGSMSATYNGVPMTSLGVWHTGGAAAGFLQVWALASPATGSHSVSVTAGGSPLGLNGGSVSFTGSGGLSAVQTAVSSGNVANASLTFTGSVSGNVVAAFVGGGSPQTPTGSFTSRYNESAGSGQQGAGYTACSTIDSPGGSVTASWTMNADLSAVAAVEVQAGTGPVQAPQQQRGGKRYRSHFGHRQTPLPALVAPPVVTVNAGVATASAVAPPAYAPRAVIAGLGGTGAGFFADQGGSPRFLLADNPWALIANAGRWGGTWQSDIDTYCGNRGGQGYTAVYLAPLGNAENNGVFADGRTQDGVFPFTVNGTAASTASLSGSETIGLNATFWARVDYFLAACLSNGMTGMLNVAYEGPGDFAAGGAYATMTASQFGQYGTALAARYAATANIIWVVGNDYFGGTGGTIGSGGGTPAGDDAKFSSLLSGLRGGGDAHAITIHNFAESNSREDLGSGTAGTVLQWGNNNAQFSGTYSYNVTYLGIEASYGEPSPIPVMLLDGYFYQGSATYAGGSGAGAYDRAFRQDTWHAVSSGARGVSQGSESIWQWPSTALAASGTGWFHVNNAAHIRTLVESLPNWHLLIPDTGSVLVTAGRGTRATAFASGGGHGQYEVAFTDSYVTASRTAAGDLALIYLSHATTITIDQTKMVSGYVAYWADPITGAKTSTGTGTTYNSATPGNNSQGDPDWVLVLQAATPGAAPAGVAAATAAAAAPTVAVSAFAGVAAATGTALAPAHAATASAGVAPALAVAPAATVSTSAGTSAPAGVAAATAVALAPSVAITASAPAAASSAVAPQPLISAAAASGPAAAAGTSLAATGATGARPGAATGSATALPPAPALTVPAGAAASLAIAPPATVSTSGNTNVPAGVASATGAALSPAVAATVPAGIAAATATAPAATGQAARLAPAGVAAASGTAPGPALTLASSAHATAAAALAQALPANAVSVLPFTVGTLTASAASAATLTAASAPGGTAGGTITSSTQRTGGPS